MSEANGTQTSTAAGDALENLLQENRKFAPSAEFAAAAVAKPGVYAEAEAVKAARRPAPSVVDADGPVGLELVEESESA